MKTLNALLMALVAASAGAQTAADGPVLGARPARATTGLKMYLPEGRLRIVGWDRDSIHIRGRISRRDSFFFGGGLMAMKFGVEERDGKAAPADLVVYLPREAKISVKTITASVDAKDVSGWFYSVSGAIHLSGAATSIEVESMNGNLDLDLTTPWLRARTGDGHLLLRGTPQDVDASTIGGTLDIVATTVLRGQFGSVSGDIHYVGAPASGGIFEFSNHSGSIDLVMPQNVSGVFALSSIVGPIENGFAQVRPIASAPHSMRLKLGNGGSQVAVRTFKGTIRIRPQ